MADPSLSGLLDTEQSRGSVQKRSGPDVDMAVWRGKWLPGLEA